MSLTEFLSYYRLSTDHTAKFIKTDELEVNLSELTRKVAFCFTGKEYLLKIGFTIQLKSLNHGMEIIATIHKELKPSF